MFFINHDGITESDDLSLILSLKMGIIRLLLALSVVAAHCGTIWKFDLIGGQVAVQSFYIISGFYMSLVLNEKYVDGNSSYKLFITNRMLRLYPIYWVVVLLSIVTCIIIGILSKGVQPTTLTNYTSLNINIGPLIFLIISNIVIFGQDIVMFLGLDTETGNFFFTKNFAETPVRVNWFLFIQQAWTLALELMFYLIAPFILKKGWRLIILLIISSFVLRLVLYNYFRLQNDPWTYRFFPAELMFFMFGYISYQIYLKIKNMKIGKIYIFILYNFVIGFSIIYTFLPQYKIEFSPFSIKEILYFAMIILSIPVLFLASKKSRIDGQIGELSYPVYISHLFVYMLCMNTTYITLKSGLPVALLTVLFSIILNKLIAEPVEKFRQARLAK